MLRQGMQKNGDDVRPSPRFRNRFETKLAIEDVQIALRRDEEYVIWLEDQSFRDQLHRHFGVARENLMEQGSYAPQVTNNDDRNAHIGRQAPKQPDIGVEPARRPPRKQQEIPYWQCQGFLL
jgi:hypothetical protein